MCGVLGIYDNEAVIAKIYDAMLTIQQSGTGLCRNFNLRW